MSPELVIESILKLREWHHVRSEHTAANPQGWPNSMVCLCCEVINLDDYMLHGRCLGWSEDVMRRQTKISFKFAVGNRMEMMRCNKWFYIKNYMENND